MSAQITFLLQKSLEQLQVGNLSQAEDFVKKGLAIQPKNFDCLHIFGVIKSLQGNFEDAVQALRSAVEIKKNDFGVQFNLAKALMELGSYSESLVHHRKAINLNPANVDCLVNYAKSLKELDQSAEALTVYDKALKLNSADFEIWTYKGIVLNELGRHDDALQAFDNSLRIHPNFLSAIFSKGVTFFDLENYDQAIIQYERFLAVDSANQLVWLNKGQAHHELRQYEKALEAYRRAYELNPNLHDAVFLESLTALTLGDMENGLKKFEARFLKTNAPAYLHPEILPVITLDQVCGKTVLVWEEEGFGDAIQFSRYISRLLSLGAKVIFETRPELARLFGYIDGITVIERGQQYGGVDFQIPLQSLPHLFGERVATIPNADGYLAVPNMLVQQWSNLLCLGKDRLNIGVATFMNPKYINSPISKKIMPLSLLEPLLQKANLFVLQKSIPESDRGFADKHPEIQYLGDEIQDFADSAAIIESMDLIISVDTSIAHLAGALGKKTFILLASSADWRWFLDDNKSPWYAKAKLFRQKTTGNWGDPINDICSELKINF